MKTLFRKYFAYTHSATKTQRNDGCILLVNKTVWMEKGVVPDPLASYIDWHQSTKCIYLAMYKYIYSWKKILEQNLSSLIVVSNAGA